MNCPYMIAVRSLPRRAVFSCAAHALPAGASFGSPGGPGSYRGSRNTASSLSASRMRSGSVGAIHELPLHDRGPLIAASRRIFVRGACAPGQGIGRFARRAGLLQGPPRRVGFYASTGEPSVGRSAVCGTGGSTPAWGESCSHAVATEQPLTTACGHSETSRPQ